MRAGVSAKHLSASVALWHLGMRRTVKGAIIIGLLVGFMAIAQGLAFGSTYPDEKSRMAFAATMESAPALGILYGETKNLTSSAGYMIYRTIPIMGLVAAIWATMTMTKLLRGQEEEGQWEAITAGKTTSRHTSGLLFLGFISSLLTTILITTSMIAAAGISSELSVSPFSSFMVAVSIFLPALLFASISVFASQLAVTRRRALVYVLVPLVIFFALRAVGNTIPDLYWLKNLTPFGWADMASPIINPQIRWFIPPLLIAPLFVGLGLYLSKKRDLGAGFIAESTKSTSRFYLLKSALSLALRQDFLLFAGWAVVSVGMSILLASIMGIAAEAVTDSPSLGNFIGQLGGSLTDMKVAFLGAGMVFVVITLLIMATVSLASIRKDEAKNYLDTLLAQPVSRSNWLAGRLAQILIAFTLISIICVFCTWVIAGLQHISLDLWNMFLISIALTGTVIFLLGFGAMLYGLFPRFGAAGMYAVIVWSFLIDILGSVVKLNDAIVQSSLLHYVSVSPTTAPDWGTFTVLLLLGFGMAGIGVFAFTKRDIVSG